MCKILKSQESEPSEQGTLMAPDKRKYLVTHFMGFGNSMKQEIKDAGVD
jgi:hypothetical protein